MDWHIDQALFEVPQIEVSLTLSNDSDSRVEWVDAAGDMHSLWLAPNSAFVVQAETLWHRVLPVTSGERAIVKAAFTTTDKVVDSFYTEFGDL